MISKKELKCVENLIETEKETIEIMTSMISEINEPQLRSETENVISSHRNHTSKLLKALENKDEK